EKEESKFLKSIIGLGSNFLNVFTSFGDIVSKVLGFSTETKKSDVGAYFKTVQNTIQGTKDKLNKIVANMKREGNPNASATETAVKTLIDNTLDKIIEGAKTASEAIGIAGDELIGNVAAVGAGAAGAKGETENLIKGIKDIVDIVLKNEGNAEAGDDKKVEDGNSSRGANAGEAGKLFGNTGNNGAITDADAKKAAVDATKAVGAVTSADILQAIFKGNEGKAAKLANTNPTAAAGGADANNAKDATIAGGIALRAMAKGGKFANGNSNTNVTAAIKGAAVSAVAKALDTLTIAIRKTIDAGLKTVEDSMKIAPDDTPVTSDKMTSKATTNN
ncbi:VlpC65-2, partial (plasmid) [Borrelia hermsii HS1]